MAGYIGSKAVLLSTTAATVTGDMTVDTSTLKVDSSNNRVGIGTASPSHPIHVVTSTDGTGVSGDDKFVAVFQNAEATDGRSYGVKIMAGSTTDQALTITDHDGSNDLMAVDGYGHVTMPKQPAFLVAKSASQDFDRNTDVTITFDTEVFDNNADFSSNTFTAAVTGKYQFNANVRVDLVDNGAEYYLLYIRTSNRDHYKLLATDDFSSDPAFWTWSSSFLTDMDANDTAYLQIKQYGGSPNHSHVEGSATWTNFSGYLVC